jgi:hypothetical protein
MAVRMFRYDTAEAQEHSSKEGGVQTINFPKSMVIYLEPPVNTPDYELLRVRFPDGVYYEYRVPVIKLTELSVEELAERRLLIFAPLYILKLRQKLKRAKTPGERKRLAAELAKTRKLLAVCCASRIKPQKNRRSGDFLPCKLRKQSNNRDFCGIKHKKYIG